MNDIINTELVYDTRDIIHFNDQFVHVQNVASTDLVTWDEFQECMIQNYQYECSIMNKVESDYDHVSSVEIRTKDNTWELRTQSPNKIDVNGSPSWGPQDYFEDGYGIIIKNFDDKNTKAKKLLRFLLETFYINIENHGIWPAFINQYSGHVHVYGALKNSNFLGLHSDPFTNFIFVTDGEIEVDVYKNRACTIMDHQLPVLLPVDKRKEQCEKLELDETIVASAGDMLYIPNRLFHHLKPKENSLYMNIPLILKGPMAL